MDFEKKRSPGVDWNHVTQDMQQWTVEHGNERVC